MRNTCLALIAISVLATTGFSGTETSRFKRFASPQIVSGGDFTTEIVLLNTSTEACDIRITYHLGAGQFPDPPLQTNGEDKGNRFQLTIPAEGTMTLGVTTTGTSLFAGAAVVDALSPSCFHALNVQTQYRQDQSGQLTELFSYPTPVGVPLNSCADAPVNFDPDGSDGETNIPGLANVRFGAVDAMRRMQLFDTEGNFVALRQPEPFDGSHALGLLTDFFPQQGAFSGSWRVCIMGEQPATASFPIVIDTLFIDVVQSGSIVQFDSNNHSVTNLDCRPDKRTLCLGGRFQVRAEASAPPLVDQPGEVQDILPDDTGFFFFTDPEETKLLIKVLDGCQVNGHFWVFYGSTTDVEFTITVTDTRGRTTMEFFNPLGQPAPAIVDTQAFATCP